MPCTPITLPCGARAIVCTRGPRMRCACGRLATLQCDAPTPGKLISSGPNAGRLTGRGCRLARAETAGSVRQRVVSLLALAAGDAAAVSFGSKFSTARLQAAEHVGEHRSWGAGCRADGGSGGTAGAGVGGKAGGVLAQALSSISSGSSIAARTSGPGLGSMGSLLLRRQPARGFDQGAVHGVLAQRGGVGLDLGGHTRLAPSLCLPAGGEAQAQRDDSSGGVRPEHHPSLQSGRGQGGIATVCPASACVQSLSICI